MPNDHLVRILLLRLLLLAILYFSSGTSTRYTGNCNFIHSLRVLMRHYYIYYSSYITIPYYTPLLAPAEAAAAIYTSTETTNIRDCCCCSCRSLVLEYP